MKIFGKDLFTPSTEVAVRRKSGDDIAHFDDSSGGWWPIVREGFAGAWQQNITIRRDTLLAFTAVYACVTRISRDIGKMPMCIKKKDDKTGVWSDIQHNSPYYPVLAKPNDYQTRIQFLQQWTISKLLTGNAYILKEYNKAGIVTKMYVLDPTRVRPLITPDGSIYYELGRDPLSDLQDATIAAPANEIIHDRMPALFHPLIGTSPIFACGLAAAQGNAIQKSSAAFFRNQAQPSGILTAPGAISDEVAGRLKTDWNSKFSGRNVGMVAVLGDGLTFAPLSVSAVDAQLIEQLKWSGETVCSAFSVPPFMVGIGAPPTYTNIEALTQQYWSQCLQSLIEDIETNLDEGLGLVNAKSEYGEIGVELDLDVLLRMDTATRFKTWKDAVSGGFMSPNEARLKENMAPVEGGESPYLQVQNYSLAALARRDEAAAPDVSGSGGDGSTGPADTGGDGTNGPTTTKPNAGSAPGTEAGSDEPAPEKFFKEFMIPAGELANAQ